MLWRFWIGLGSFFLGSQTGYIGGGFWDNRLDMGGGIFFWYILSDTTCIST
jgi:hypothetical protein